jgi:tetratricopeptide (TPR) repeat protein
MPRHRVSDLIRRGDRLRSRGEALRAEPRLRRAVLVADSQRDGTNGHRDLPAALNALGVLCKDLARYDEGRALYERALAVLECSPASYEHDVATLYHNLGGIEYARGDFKAAETLARRGLALRKRLGNDDDALARDLVALAAILDGQRRYDEAETMYLEALSILERAPELNRDEIAVALNNLGAQYFMRGKTTSALHLLSRAERIKRESLGAGHSDLAVTLNNLAKVRQQRGDFSAADRLYREAVAILEGALGADHPRTAACRHNLSVLEKSLMPGPNEERSAREILRIDLTLEQKRVVKAATSRDAEAIELSVDELESRIAPFTPTIRLAGNHNETLLLTNDIG